jgi:hypothetical protein
MNAPRAKPVVDAIPVVCVGGSAGQTDGITGVLRALDPLFV